MKQTTLVDGFIVQWWFNSLKELF